MYFSSRGERPAYPQGGLQVTRKLDADAGSPSLVLLTHKNIVAERPVQLAQASAARSTSSFNLYSQRR